MRDDDFPTQVPVSGRFHVCPCCRGAGVIDSERRAGERPRAVQPVGSERNSETNLPAPSQGHAGQLDAFHADLTVNRRYRDGGGTVLQYSSEHQGGPSYPPVPLRETLWTLAFFLALAIGIIFAP